MDMRPAKRSRSRRLAALGTLMSVALAAAALPGIAGAATPETPAPTSATASEEVIPWPGARGGPAGVRAWSPGDRRSWMHHSAGEGEGWVSLTFETRADDASDLDLPVANVADMYGGVDLEGPYKDVPERLADVRVQAWFMDVDGQTVVIMVKSLSNTPPALVAEAEAVVESIRVDPIGDGQGPRLLFDLSDGWDTG